ncbi:hypothetical protein [Pseudomonas sp. NIBRBAC000502773]|jgi:hypothetical protein|uniref:DUF6896 domain-containing protein n=1 Tax=Pseudomonas TaxID=286 RepID=UPI0035A1CAAF
MRPANVDCAFLFATLQSQLVLAFAELYPNARDSTWLLDFPKRGDMLVDGEQWQFLRHGAGIRFERVSRKPHWVVDVHKRFDEPKIIDNWRVLHFFESCGVNMDESQVSSLLRELCLKGHLLDQGNGQFLFVG